MKLLFLIFSLSYSVAFGQISIKELISVSKLDSEAFEIYAMKKGFNFHRLENSENSEAIVMQQFFSETAITRYISWHSRYFTERYHSNYQTSQTNELQKMYQDLGSLGFKLSSRFESNDHYQKTYSQGKEVVIFYIKPDWIEIGYSMSE